MKQGLFTLLRSQYAQKFYGIGQISCEETQTDLATIFFFDGRPIHFISPKWGGGFAGLLELYKWDQLMDSLCVTWDHSLYLVDSPNILYSYERLVMNLLESFREHKISQKLLVTSPEYFLEY